MVTASALTGQLFYGTGSSYLQLYTSTTLVVTTGRAAPAARAHGARGMAPAHAYDHIAYPPTLSSSTCFEYSRVSRVVGLKVARLSDCLSR